MNTSQFFGRSTEYRVSSMLLDEHRELYLPAVDDHGVDMIVRTRAACSGDDTRPEHYEFQEIQVKSASSGGLFAAIKCDDLRFPRLLFGNGYCHRQLGEENRQQCLLQLSGMAEYRYTQLCRDNR